MRFEHWPTTSSTKSGRSYDHLRSTAAAAAGAATKPTRVVDCAIVAIIVIGLGAVFASRFGRNPDLAASALIGRPAPETSMPYLEFADELSLADLKGDIVVVNFWAAWCPGCRDEHDDLVAAAANYADIGVSIVEYSTRISRRQGALPR